MKYLVICSGLYVELANALMALEVFRLIFKKFEIGQTVVRFYTVFVMDNFRPIQKSFYLFHHYKAVFSDISVYGQRVFGLIQIGVSRCLANSSPSFPCGMWMRRPMFSKLRSCFFRRFFPTGRMWVSLPMLNHISAMTLAETFMGTILGSGVTCDDLPFAN